MFWKHQMGAWMNSVVVKVLNFEKYKGRKDVEHNSWFRCSNRLLEDPDFYDFLSDELLAWIYILSLTSQKNIDTVTVNFDHAEKVCRIRKKHMISAIEKLKGKQIDIIDVTSTLRPRNADDTQTCATEHNKTDITNKTVNKRKKEEPELRFESYEDLIKAIPEKKMKTWVNIYDNDQPFITRQVILAYDFYTTRGDDAKTLRGWQQALSYWLEKSWEKRPKAQPKKDVFDFLNDIKDNGEVA